MAHSIPLPQYTVVASAPGRDLFDIARRMDAELSHTRACYAAAAAECHGARSAIKVLNERAAAKEHELHEARAQSAAFRAQAERAQLWAQQRAQQLEGEAASLRAELARTQQEARGHADAASAYEQAAAQWRAQFAAEQRRAAELQARVEALAHDCRASDARAVALQQERDDLKIELVAARAFGPPTPTLPSRLAVFRGFPEREAGACWGVVLPPSTASDSATCTDSGAVSVCSTSDDGSVSSPPLSVDGGVPASPWVSVPLPSLQPPQEQPPQEQPLQEQPPQEQPPQEQPPQEQPLQEQPLQEQPPQEQQEFVLQFSPKAVGSYVVTPKSGTEGGGCLRALQNGPHAGAVLRRLTEGQWQCALATCNFWNDRRHHAFCNQCLRDSKQKKQVFQPVAWCLNSMQLAQYHHHRARASAARSSATRREQGGSPSS